MGELQEIQEELSHMQKKIVQELAKPGSTLLFNIKGMLEVLHEGEPFHFMEMGYDDVAKLRNLGLLDARRTHEEAHVLEGELYELSGKGKLLAQTLEGGES